MSLPRAYLSEIFASFQGEGSRVGQRHLFVRFAGCNVRCVYCDTPDSLTKVATCVADRPDGSRLTLENPVALDDLVALIEEWCTSEFPPSMIAITGGEPMMQAEFLAEWLGSKPPPVGCLLETNALLAEAAPAVLERVEVVSADLKLASNSGIGDTEDRHRRFFRACVAARGGGQSPELYVKMPVDAETPVAEVLRGADLLQACAPGSTLYVQPLSDPISGRWLIEMDRLDTLVAAAASRGAETRMLPQVHKLLGVR